LTDDRDLGPRRQQSGDVVIEQIGPRQFALLSRKGKILGIHRNRSDAVRQERAIQISKARRAGHPIPLPLPRRR